MTRGAFTTSWDDGTTCDIRMAGFLYDLGITGTFYASTGPSGVRLLSDDDMGQIAARHELGNHGRSHQAFTSLTNTEILDEVTWAEVDLARFGRPASIVAPPGGKTDQRINRLLIANGYAVRVAPVVGSGTTARQIIDPSLALYPHTTVELLRNIVRRRRVPAVGVLRIWAQNRDAQARLRALVQRCAERHDVLHIWGHSADVHRLELWTSSLILLSTF